MGLAKTTRPATRSAVPRPQLFRVLDQARQRLATWVCSPPGAGKTTLVSSYVAVRKLRSLWYHVDEGDEDLASFFYYVREAAPGPGLALPLLTPEYVPSLMVFAHQFFRRLFSRLRPPFAFVLDNYQTIGSRAGLHEVLAAALDEVPAGGHVIVVSRELPPPAFARLVANRAVGLLDYEALRLTDHEARCLVSHLHGRLAATRLEEVVATAQGWAAGLVLLSARQGSDDLPAARQRGPVPPPEVIFDYFAHQIFAALDAEAQAVLVRTAFLPRTTAAMAASLTGVARAGEILADLARRNYFTNQRADGEAVYQYHDLFREFLQARARVALSPAELADVQRRAAELLVDAEQLDAAAGLFRDAMDWEGLTRLIESRAPELLRHGRSQTVLDWLAALPDERVVHAPWLLYWRGMCRMPLAPGLAREDFERALPLFRSQQDAAGAFLTWSAAVDSFPQESRDAHPLDDWIPVLAQLRRQFPQFPSAAVEEQVDTSMFMSLSWRQPGHPDMTSWVQRAFDILKSSQTLELRVRAGLFLVNLYFLGHMGTARQALEILTAAMAGKQTTPLLALTVKAATAAYQVAAGETRACLETVGAAIRQGETAGVHVWTFQLLANGASAALSCGDREAAGRLIEQMTARVGQARRCDFWLYQHLVAWRALIDGNLALAATYEEASLASAIELGMPITEVFSRNLLTQIRHAQGRAADAADEIRRSLELARAMGSRLAEWAGGLVEAQIALDQGDEARGLERLAHALALGREYGLVNVWTWHPLAMARLCATALTHGIEVDYVRFLIRSRGLHLDAPPRDLERWPWPVKVYTLGRFAVHREDQPVSFAGKIQKRPLALLKTLIACGGEDIPEETIADALWPDAEGDAAARALTTTIHRLRRLLGHDGCVLRQGGRLSLDPRICWVDVSAFETCLSRAVASALPDVLRWTEQAVGLYRGAFLGGEADVPGALAMADRLRRRWRRHLSSLAGRLTASGRDEAALRWYELALEVDDDAEDCYRDLMATYRRLGAEAEASAIDRRYRAAMVRRRFSAAPEAHAPHQAAPRR